MSNAFAHDIGDFLRSGLGPVEMQGADRKGNPDVRAIEPVVIACMFEEIDPNLTRISLRSKNPKVDVNKVAQLFGGGGHPAAAGARVEGTPLSTQRKVVAALKKALNGVG